MRKVFVLVAAGVMAGLSGAAALAEGTESAPTTVTPSVATPAPLDNVIVYGATVASAERQWADADAAAAPDLPVIDAAQWLPSSEDAG